jgi:hypothetical protein
VRAAIIVAVTLILPFLACPAPALAIGPAPILTLVLTPASTVVDTNGTVTVSININGTATLQKGRFDRTTYTVTLAPEVDAGWQCAASPSELTFADSGSQDFDCTVVIPPMHGDFTANLTVQGLVIGGGLTTGASATSQMIVSTTLANMTNTTTITRTGATDGLSPFIVLGLVIAVAAAASLVYLRFFRKRNVS